MEPKMSNAFEQLPPIYSAANKCREPWIMGVPENLFVSSQFYKSTNRHAECRLLEALFFSSPYEKHVLTGPSLVIQGQLCDFCHI
jgi:hypothetical protein